MDSVALGVCLILLGTLWTLSNLGKIDLLSTLRTWWPLALVIWGALEVAEVLRRRAGSRKDPP